jgi:hypothetical protein
VFVKLSSSDEVVKDSGMRSWAGFVDNDWTFTSVSAAREFLNELTLAIEEVENEEMKWMEY